MPCAICMEDIETTNEEIDLIGEKSIIMTANTIVELELTKTNEMD